MNKLGPKTHVAGVVGLSMFDSPLIWILLTGNKTLNSTKLSHITTLFTRVS